MSLIIKNIMQIIDYKSINKSKFYKQTGLSNGFLDKVKDVGVSKIEQILNTYPEINPEWLITGKGEMLRKSDNQLNEPSHVYQLRTDKKESEQLIPLYDLNAAASVVEIFNNTQALVPLDHIQIPNLPKCDGALHITGDSMYPLLKSGDIVLYREVQDKQNIVWGEMYLIYLNNNGDEFFFCKYIHQSDKEGHVKFVSQNKHHQPVEFPVDSIQQLAIVKASIRVNSVV